MKIDLDAVAYRRLRWPFEVDRLVINFMVLDFSGLKFNLDRRRFFMLHDLDPIADFVKRVGKLLLQLAQLNQDVFVSFTRDL